MAILKRELSDTPDGRWRLVYDPIIERSSTTDEIARRIDESFKYRDWRDERERLIAAAFADLRSHPNPAATKAAIGKMEESSERDIQNELMDLFRAKPLDQSGEPAKPVVSAPSPDELVTQSREAKRQRHEKRIDAGR